MFKNNPLLLLSVIISAMLHPSAFAAPAEKTATSKPLKIYILAGQSNMQGKAAPSTVPRMALSPESKPLHDKFLNDAGEPIVHDNVSIVYFTGGDEKKGESRPLIVEKGKLAIGTLELIGPELGFGVTMDEAVDQPILIIKTAWGGKSLNYNFRPPSAGLRPFEAPKPKKGKELSAEELKAAQAEFEKDQGSYYRLMMKLIGQVLADPGQYSEAYDPKQGYEIGGFCWFQGYNDQFYYPGSCDFYSEALAHFIRDVRKELKAPKMPFVIGVIGIDGSHAANPKMLELRKAMAAPARMPEFKGNVAAIETAQFWDDEMLVAIDKVSQAQAMWDQSEHWKPIGKPTLDERAWSYTSFNVDPEKQYTEPEVRVFGADRIFNMVIPAGMEDWLKPDFDTGTWQKGPAPIGKGDQPKPRAKKGEDPKAVKKLVSSPWGEGNMLLAKTSFDMSHEDISDFRLCYQSTSSFMIYLNGERLMNYPWWKDVEIRKDPLDAKHVIKGTNHLAFYGNILDRKGVEFNAVDVYLEGLTKDGAAEIRKQQATVATPKDIALSKGKSNQAYHYLGSAYTYSLIGEAMAKAMKEMK